MSLLSFKLQFKQLHSLTWILSSKIADLWGLMGVQMYPVHPPWLRAWVLFSVEGVYDWHSYFPMQIWDRTWNLSAVQGHNHDTWCGLWLSLLSGHSFRASEALLWLSAYTLQFQRVPCINFIMADLMDGVLQFSFLCMSHHPAVLDNFKLEIKKIRACRTWNFFKIIRP